MLQKENKHILVKCQKANKVLNNIKKYAKIGNKDNKKEYEKSYSLNKLT